MTTGDRAGSNRPDRTLTIVTWQHRAPTEVTSGIATHSDAALYWWTPILGPTAMLMAHRFASYAGANQRTTFTRAEIAAMLGLGRAVAKVDRSVSRLERFGVAEVQGDIVAVRTVLPPLTRRLRAQLPDHLVGRTERSTD